MRSSSSSSLSGMRMIPSAPQRRGRASGSRSAQGCPGKIRLCIGEAQLVWACSVASSTWIDGRRLVDGGDVAALEEVLDGEFEEAMDRHFDAMRPRGDADERIDDHRGDELQADCVLILAEELAQFEKLRSRMLILVRVTKKAPFSAISRHQP